MTSGTMLERGDLLLIPFPFTDLSATKRRPVLALTPADSYGDFIALPVTSRPRPEHAVPLQPADLVAGILPAPSWIRTDRIVTLSESLVIKAIGRVSNSVVETAVREFCVLIGHPV